MNSVEGLWLRVERNVVVCAPSTLNHKPSTRLLLMPDLTELNVLPEVDDADRVVGLIARLPRENIVRRLTVQIVQGRPLESVQPLVHSLITGGIRRWRERQAAA